MTRLATRQVCSGCGAAALPGDPYPFRCPRAREGDDVDHVLRRILDVNGAGRAGAEPEAERDAGVAPGCDVDVRALFLESTPNPFLRYRHLFHAYQIGVTEGLSDEELVTIIRELDTAVAAVDGRGFRETPFAPERELARGIGLPSASVLWVKNETSNVSGSHKARHLMGIMLWLRVMERLGRIAPGELGARGLAIASCGNAALAAAVVAAAADQHLDVFVPPDADPVVVARLQRHGAHLTACPRRGGESGDPCYLRFREALRRNEIPFSVQGSDNGLTLEGGLTLGYEMVSRLMAESETLDRLFIQVGGGALASSCVQALEEAHTLGLLDRVPRIHAVQTRGGHPLWRAHARVVRELLGIEGFEPEDVVSAHDCADAIVALGAPRIEEEVRAAAQHRSSYMWPWETPPHSVATGILDDETYDWLAVVRGMLLTGGFPLVVSEPTLVTANDVARRTTDVPVDATGTAGLAGIVDLAGAGLLRPGERIGVLFTGSIRSPSS